MTKSLSLSTIRLSDEAWIVVALLHRENPVRKDFTISEIVQRAEREGICGELRPGFRAHVTSHCVANLPPNPGKTRMLYATGKHTRRLYRSGDDYHPAREGSDTRPKRSDVPTPYKELLEWHEAWVSSQVLPPAADPFMELYGSGKDLWADEKPDDYVRRLREGWE